MNDELASLKQKEEELDLRINELRYEPLVCL